jgi:tRNA U34 5-methylaminomethyl-2-thiouridine-forming methyltransferase MnmC
MKREIIITKDGSHSFSIPGMKLTYHSAHGAIHESTHVFIDGGLHYMAGQVNSPGTLNIFEMGFGTGLNVLLTLIETGEKKQRVFYETVETSPLEISEAILLNYCGQLQRPGLKIIFEQLHTCEWNKEIEITPCFTFKKNNTNLLDFSGNKLFNLVYFDAFAPAVQPELWTAVVFSKLYRQMETNGILVTYCSKTIVRKAMEAAGFKVTKIAGPYGKREMVRAIKI